MATIQDRPFSKNYRYVCAAIHNVQANSPLSSGLVYQSVIAGVILVATAAWLEFVTRQRRGKRGEAGLGSVESWQFG